jgi:hypothetical protein
MHAVEFTTELSASPVLSVPKEAAEQLPKSGKARVIVLTNEDQDEAEWRKGSYEQFLREEWAGTAAKGLAGAYGDGEPEYSEADIKR